MPDDGRKLVLGAELPKTTTKTPVVPHVVIGKGGGGGELVLGANSLKGTFADPNFDFAGWNRDMENMFGLKPPTPVKVKLPPVVTKKVKTVKVPAARVNTVSDKQERIRNETLLATNEVVSSTFGKDRFFAKPFIVGTDGTRLVVAFLVGLGEIGQITRVWRDGNIESSGSDLNGIYLQKYTGISTQGVDPQLEAAFPLGFWSTYIGFAYVVMGLPPGEGVGFPRIEVEIKGLRVKRYDTHSPLLGPGLPALNSNPQNPTLWTAFGATTVDNATNIGAFKEVQVQSAGAVTDVLRFVNNQQWNAGYTILAIQIYYKAGTSGRIRLDITSIPVAQTSTITAAIGGTYTTTSNAAGTLTFTSDTDLGEYRVARFMFVPTNPGYHHHYGVGPDSVTVGQSIIAYGAMVEHAWLNNGLPEYSDNPVNVCAWVMTQNAKWAVNAASAATAAIWCNDILPHDTRARNVIGMTFSSATKVSDLIENLRAYTGCSVAWDNGEIHFIPYKARPVTHTFNADSIMDDGFKLAKKKPNEIPTMVVVQYTDDIGDKFQKREVTVKSAGVDEGTIPRRISRVNLPGIRNHNQALREAIERLNTGLSDLSLTMSVFDEGLAVQIGDVCSVTHPIGLASKQMFITGMSQSKPGLWKLELEEYDPLLFSDVVESEPSYPDTVLPIHDAPGAITGITLTEEVYQRRSGEYDSRIRVTWNASTNPYAKWYIVRFKIAGSVVASVQETGLVTAYGPVQELVQYTVDVVAVTTIFEGAAGSATITPQGKYLIPGNVSNFYGLEAGGECRFSWDAAIDLDIVGYELRYGAAAVTWANAALINVVDSLKYTTKEIPEGTWDFLIKAVDSVGQVSTTEARVTFEVTVDQSISSGIFQTLSDSATGDLKVYRVKEVRESNDVIYTNSNSQTWATLFGGASLSGKTNALASYQSTPGSNFQYITAAHDFTFDIPGDWTRQITWTNYSGGALVTYLSLATAAAYPTYTDYSATVVPEVGRYARVKIAGLGLARLEVPNPTIRIAIETRSEQGSGTSSTGGATQVDLTSSFTAMYTVLVTPLFSGTPVAVIPVVDNVVLGATPHFDVHIFSAANPTTRVAVDFSWTWSGV